MLDERTAAACRGALERYRAVLSPAEVHAAQLTVCGGGFSGALVMRVDAGGRSWCLRRWPQDSLPPPRLRELHRWLRFLQQHAEIPVAVPLPGSDGSTLSEIDGRLWQFEPWLPGTADYHEHSSDARLHSAAQVLARLHAASADYRCIEEGRAWFTVSHGPSPAVRERIQLIDSQSPANLANLASELNGLRGVAAEAASDALSLYSRLAARIRVQLAGLSHTAVPRFPCLRDVWHDHVLFTGEDVTGLVDPSAARFESAAADLARLLGSLVGDDARAWELALTAYAERRFLTPDERRLAYALDSSGVVLSGLTWAQRLVGEMAAPDDARVEQRLHYIVQRMRQLEQSELEPIR